MPRGRILSPFLRCRVERHQVAQYSLGLSLRQVMAVRQGGGQMLERDSRLWRGFRRVSGFLGCGGSFLGWRHDDPSRTMALVMWVSERVDKNLVRQSRHPWCIALGTCHIRDIATYTVTPKADRTGFDVSILDGKGALQTTLNFANEAEANAWVTQATRNDQTTSAGARIRKREIPMITQALSTAQHPALGRSCSIRVRDWSPPPRTNTRLASTSHMPS